MTWFPAVPHLFVEAVINTPWTHIAFGIAAGIPLTILFLGILTWLLDRTTGGPIGPTCDQCEQVVDEVAPYDLAGPGRHSTRNVCDSCWLKLMRLELGAFGEESPSFGRHADEALALVREADEVCTMPFGCMCSHCRGNPCPDCGEVWDSRHRVGELCPGPLVDEQYDVEADFEAARAPRKDQPS